MLEMEESGVECLETYVLLVEGVLFERLLIKFAMIPHVSGYVLNMLIGVWLLETFM